MSWQATAWAIKQATGSTRRKAMLLALANYADPNGVCWPSQERLATDTEQSVDSVQRHSQALEKMKLLEREIMPKRRGQYAGYRYRLAMLTDQADGTQAASLSRSSRSDHTAKSRGAAPQSLRSKPSIEPSYKHPHAKPSFEAAEARLRAFQAKQEPLEVVQHRIAQRIGYDGWLVLGDMNDNQRQRLSKLERQGRLDDETLCNAVLAARLAARS
ncbi:helix-turn-helix domain-containing protein [Bradyrhizobium erythrophlei]|uniref:helix-turn-helix domain-containing protein n=1 Tax=Bradyrhizobium erythrophlei TaxID=1437360 RepID=UPI0035E8CADA